MKQIKVKAKQLDHRALLEDGFARFVLAALAFLAVMSLLGLPSAFAQGDEASFELEEESAQTQIEFDEGLIEDVDLRRLEFGAITGRTGLKKKHLYRKMMTFDREMNESFREFRYQQ